jgi:hypothetical protein
VAVNGTAGGGGADIGIIAAGIAIPLALIALAACTAAAALALWRRRQNNLPTIPAITTDINSMSGLTVSPLYESRTVTHVNELYAGDEVPSSPVPGAGSTRDEVLAAHNMSWDRV